MLANPLVSIIIPAYDAAPFLAATLASVIAQTWSNWEVLVVDDGSNDGTLGIAASFGDARIRILSQEHRGAAAARNAGKALARGDYLMFLDADDLLQPRKIEAQVEALRTSGDPERISSCSWARFVGDPSRAVFVPEPVWSDMKPVEWLTSAWSGGGMMQTACWLVPRSVVMRAGEWDARHLHLPTDDSDYFTRVLLQSSGIVFCKEAVVLYRSNVPGSLSSLSSREVVSAMVDSLTTMERAIRSVEDSERTRRSMACLYSELICRFHPRHKEVLQFAYAAIERLGFEHASLLPAGRLATAASLIGVRNALKLRALLKQPA